MADVTVKHLDEMASALDGGFVKIRASLGASAFGVQILNFPPHGNPFKPHDHESNGQEEIYTVLRGSATLQLPEEGEEYELVPGVWARVGPSVKRRLEPGDDGAQILALGGTPGKVYEPPKMTELDAET